jgi:hypothetical protein
VLQSEATGEDEYIAVSFRGTIEFSLQDWISDLTYAQVRSRLALQLPQCSLAEHSVQLNRSPSANLRTPATSLLSHSPPLHPSPRRRQIAAYPEFPKLRVHRGFYRAYNNALREQVLAALAELPPLPIVVTGALVIHTRPICASRTRCIACADALTAVGEREWGWWAHAGGGKALAFKPPR